MKASTKVILNTCILYGNMVISALIALMSTRWILEALGETDYGIYNLVGGIIAMFSFLNVAMVAATQRFMSYAIGQNQIEKVQETFQCSKILHFFIGVIVFIIFELLGDYFLHHKLQIPIGRMDEAMIVLHCLSITTFFTIITVPYQALLNSKENMIIIALLSIYDSIMKLGIALILLKYVGDRLILYAILMMGLSISSLCFNRIYCWRHYIEVKTKWFSGINWTLLKRMFSFAGWNFIGSISSLLRNQGLAMLMNTFFGVIINAAYGIATQVNGQAQFFSRTIVRAIQPQIVKSEGAGERERMKRLALTTSKISFLMISFIISPLIAMMPFILNIWLTEVPSHTIIFCRIILLITLVSQAKIGLAIAIDSVGKIKWYQIVCGGLHFVVLPIAYYLYNKGAIPPWGLGVVLIEESITLVLTSIFAKHLVGISLKSYYLTFLLPSLISIIGCYAVGFVLILFLNNNWLKIGTFTIFYIISLSFIGYKYLLTVQEKNTFQSLMGSLNKKLISKLKAHHE